MLRDIQYLDGDPETRPMELAVIMYEGGPYADRREVVYEGVPPAAVYIPAEHGPYRKTVRCGDDGAHRYVWVSEEI
jgi:hypothetical protein